MLDIKIVSDISNNARMYVSLISQVSKVATWGALSKAGSLVQKAAQSNMKSKRTNWILYVNKKGGISLSNKGDKRVGDRQSHLSAAYVSPLSMSSMITSYQSYKSDKPMVVVGGKHRAFYPLKIDDGKVTGQMSRVNAVSESTHALLEKMETGLLSDVYSRHFGKRPKKVTAYHFMRDAVASSSGGVDSIMKKEWVAAVERGLANSSLQEVKNAV